MPLYGATMFRRGVANAAPPTWIAFFAFPGLDCDIAPSSPALPVLKTTTMSGFSQTKASMSRAPVE
jgi:hypothetical protein